MVIVTTKNEQKMIKNNGATQMAHFRAVIFMNKLEKSLGKVKIRENNRFRAD